MDIFLICQVLFFLFSRELSTRRIDIISHGCSNSRWNPVGFQNFLEFFYEKSGSRTVLDASGSLAWIIRNKIHVRQTSLQKFTQLIGKLNMIIDAIEHNVFIKNTFIGFLYVSIECCHELVEIVGMINRHDRTTKFIVGSVDRNSQTRLGEIMSHFYNSWYNSTRRYRYTTIRKIEFLLITSNLDRFFHIFIIEKWFSHSHKNDISQRRSFTVELNISKMNLLDYFGKRKIFLKTEFSRRTKRTCHRAASL